jgi:hypothetical protein
MPGKIFNKYVNYTWYKVTLPMSKKVIEVKPYGMKGNKALADLKSESEIKEDISILFNGMKNVIDSCIKDEYDIDVKKLHVVDFAYLSNKLRAITKGSFVEWIVGCDNPKTKMWKNDIPLNERTDENCELIDKPCRFDNEIKFDIEDFIVINEDKYKEMVEADIDGTKFQNIF